MYPNISKSVNLRLVFLQPQQLLTNQCICDFSLNENCKTYLGPMLPHESRNWQLIYPNCSGMKTNRVHPICCRTPPKKACTAGSQYCRIHIEKANIHCQHTISFVLSLITAKAPKLQSFKSTIKNIFISIKRQFITPTYRSPQTLLFNKYNCKVQSSWLLCVRYGSLTS